MSARDTRRPEELREAFGRAAGSTSLPPATSLPVPAKAPATPVPARRTTKRSEPAPAPKARAQGYRFVYVALDPAVAETLRECVTATRKSQVTILGEAIDALDLNELTPYLPQPTATTMPGARAAAVAIKASNFNIRTSTAQYEWITDKHAALAPDLSMRQFLGIALTRYLKDSP